MGRGSRGSDGRGREICSAIGLWGGEFGERGPSLNPPWRGWTIPLEEPSGDTNTNCVCFPAAFVRFQNLEKDGRFSSSPPVIIARRWMLIGGLRPCWSVKGDNATRWGERFNLPVSAFELGLGYLDGDGKKTSARGSFDQHENI